MGRQRGLQVAVAALVFVSSTASGAWAQQHGGHGGGFSAEMHAAMTKLSRDEEIIAAQQAEIVPMRQRLEILKTGQDMTPGGFPALGGMRGPVAP